MTFRGVFGLFICLVGPLCLPIGVVGEINIVNRTQWNAKAPLEELTPLELPVGRIIIAHTAGNECSDKDACTREARNIQNFHMSKVSYSDISYNYLIGNDGNVYEGRGWKYQGAIARGFNAGSISIGFMGTFIKNLPSPSALETAKLLMDKLRKDEKLKEDYKLLGHRQLSPTESPGAALYAEIQTWPKWSKDIQ